LKSTFIHPTALIDPTVTLGPGTEVGPFCRFQGTVQVGPDCWFGTGVVLGGRPAFRIPHSSDISDISDGPDKLVLIGSGNVFHDYTTVSRPVGKGSATLIGDNNYVMAYVHIAHNCRIGNNCILTNGVQLAGYVEVFDRANLGGLVGVHQHCRIGELAMVGAGSFVNKDIPPFVIAAGRPCRIRGINTIGLSRAGFGAEVIGVLKKVFRLLYRSGLNLDQALRRLEEALAGGEFLTTADNDERTADMLRRLIQFCRSSKRGIELRTGPERGDGPLLL